MTAPPTPVPSRVRQLLRQAVVIAGLTVIAVVNAPRACTYIETPTSHYADAAAAQILLTGPNAVAPELPDFGLPASASGIRFTQNIDVGWWWLSFRFLPGDTATFLGQQRLLTPIETHDITYRPPFWFLGWPTHAGDAASDWRARVYVHRAGRANACTMIDNEHGRAYIWLCRDRAI